MPLLLNTFCSIQIFPNLQSWYLQSYDGVYKIQPALVIAKNIIALIGNICDGKVDISIEVLVFLHQSKDMSHILIYFIPFTSSEIPTKRYLVEGNRIL